MQRKVTVLMGCVLALVAAGCGGGETETVTRTVTADEPSVRERPPDEAVQDCQDLPEDSVDVTCRDRETGTVYTFVSRSGTLRLDELEAELVSTRFAPQVLGTKANGIFFVVRLMITNRTDQPQRFDATSQASLFIEDNQYSVNDLLVSDEFFIEDLQPDVPTEGQVAFDVPPNAQAKIDDPDAQGVVGVLPFSEAETFSDEAPEAAGYIRLAE